MVQLLWPKKGYTVEKTMESFCGYPFFCHRGGDLFLTHRCMCVHPAFPPLPMCGPMPAWLNFMVP